MYVKIWVFATRYIMRKSQYHMWCNLNIGTFYNISLIQGSGINIGICYIVKPYIISVQRGFFIKSEMGQ